MNRTAHLLAPSPDAHLLNGCFQLAAHSAVTLKPRAAGVLRVAHGRIWIKVDGRGQPRADLFLCAGEQITLRRGDRLVMEPFQPHADQSAWFAWDPLPQTQAARASRWQAVVQPLDDLRLAFGFALGAAGRLLVGVAGLALARPARAAGEAALPDAPAPARALIALASARRAQGAISAGDSIALSGAV